MVRIVVIHGNSAWNVVVMIIYYRICLEGTKHAFRYSATLLKSLHTKTGQKNIF